MVGKLLTLILHVQISYMLLLTITFDNMKTKSLICTSVFSFLYFIGTLFGKGTYK